MTLAEFRASLNGPNPPPGMDLLLAALWWDAKGDWERAHRIAQGLNGRDAARVHAYLHRKEGEEGNAGYWYRQAGQAHARVQLEQEWIEIAQSLLGG